MGHRSGWCFWSQWARLIAVHCHFVMTKLKTFKSWKGHCESYYETVDWLLFFATLTLITEHILALLDNRPKPRATRAPSCFPRLITPNVWWTRSQNSYRDGFFLMASLFLLLSRQRFIQVDPHLGIISFVFQVVRFFCKHTTVLLVYLYLAEATYP